MKTKTDPRREMRTFGLIMAGGFTAVGLLLLWRGHSGEVWKYVLAAAAVFLALAFVYPPALRLVHRPWMLFGAALGWFNTRLILTVFFAAVFLPTALILRLLGKDLLNKNWKRKAESYWTPPRHTESPKERYERMS